MDYLLGIDLGTSSVKALIVTPAGTTKGSGQRSYKIDTPRPGWAEQDPETWVQATVRAVRDALAAADVSPGEIAGMGFSGQMHTTVLLDRAGGVIRPAISWSDQRSKSQVEAAINRIGKGKLAGWVQNPLATGFTLSSLLWLKEVEPLAYSKTTKVLLPKDYLRYRLTGQIGTEFTDASATLMMDVVRQVWNEELLGTFQISPSILPEVFPSTDIAGCLTRDAAKELGLKVGLPVAFGSGDQAAQAVGNNVIEPGRLSCTVGTGGQILTTSDKPLYDPELRTHTFCHAVPGRWFVMGAILSAGLCLAWLREDILHSESYESMVDAAGSLEPGAEGLIFLPYLIGERTPHMDPLAQGVFAGLTLRHTQAHLIRALMEGVIFALRENMELLRGMGLPIERVVASGGALNHPLWLKLQADVFNLAIHQTQNQEAAALGAALMAGVGVGLYEDIHQACRLAVHDAERVYLPDPAHRAAYDRAFHSYKNLYRKLKPWFQGKDQDS